MVFAEIESQLRTEGGWNMHIAIALIMALLVTAGVLWFFFAPRKAYRAPLRDGVQEAVVEVKGGYSPAVIEAEAGVPLRLIFDRKEDGECSSHVVFSDFGVDLALPAFRTTTLTLHPDQPGEYPFACGMNMLHGTLQRINHDELFHDGLVDRIGMALQHEHVRAAHGFGVAHVHFAVREVICCGFQNIDAELFGDFRRQLRVCSACDKDKVLIRLSFKDCAHRVSKRLF